MQRMYETIFIINAALEDDDIEAVIAKVGGYIENHGGKITDTSRWGRRRLAYPINKKYNGFYVHLVYETAPNSIPVLERYLVLEDTILRHLTVKLPQKLFDYRKKRSLELGKPYDQALFDKESEVKTKKTDKRQKLVIKEDPELSHGLNKSKDNDIDEKGSDNNEQKQESAESNE